MAATDAHDNHATVTLGGREYELAASLLAERIYGDRFRDSTDELGRSGIYQVERAPALGEDGSPILGEDGRPMTRVVGRTEICYTGRFKVDVAVSQQTPRAALATGDVPVQAFAAAWAMARAAGSTDASWDVFLASVPSNAEEHVALWEAVCVDLAERAIFRHREGQADAREPHDGEA